MKKDRHARVEVQCDWCGNTFSARKERVDAGLGRFCSKEHFHLWRNKNTRETVWGHKELATCYKVGNRYCARWYDAEGNTKSSSYPRWWWEINVGELLPNQIILLKDNNPLNIDPNNFELGTKSDALRKGNKTRRDSPELWKSYTDKLRSKSTGRKHTEESKRKLSIAHLNLPVVSGSGHYRWRGGIPKDYPKEFYKIREFIIGRDNSQCQICGKLLSKNQHIHHRDGIREHNDQDNLVTFCATCHGKVHSFSQASPPIMAFRSELKI